MAVPDVGALKVIALADSPPAPVPPSVPVLPSTIVQEMPADVELALSADVASVPATVAAAGCLALDQVKNSIEADPDAMTSALNAPPENRSIAEAVVIWNGDWIQAASTPDAPLSPAREAVERSVATMSEDCLNEPIIGPRLVPFPTATGTMFLVFGSGNWRWRDVADDVPLSTPASKQGTQPGLATRLRGLLDVVGRN
jgi:hypothetical protein